MNFLLYSAKTFVGILVKIVVSILLLVVALSHATYGSPVQARFLHGKYPRPCGGRLSIHVMYVYSSVL
jgi:hypothetical protein